MQTPNAFYCSFLSFFCHYWLPAISKRAVQSVFRSWNQVCWSRSCWWMVRVNILQFLSYHFIFLLGTIDIFSKSIFLIKISVSHSYMQLRTSIITRTPNGHLGFIITANDWEGYCDFENSLISVVWCIYIYIGVFQTKVTATNYLTTSTTVVYSSW